MKIKKEYVILAVIIFALTGYLLVKKTNRLHYTLPKVPTLTQKDITKLEIQKAGQQTTLTKKEGKWLITPGNYVADQGKMNRIIDMIRNFSINTLISESNDYLRYDLTKEKKIAVKVYGKTGPIFSFSVGKHAPTFKHTFVTIEGDPKVYLARGNFRSDFDQTADELRDKHVFSFSRDTLSSIEITEAGNKFDLKKKVEKSSKTKEKKTTTGDHFQWIDANGKTVPGSSVNGLFSQLTDLQCESYIQGKNKNDFKHPILIIALDGKNGATLTVFDKNDSKDNSYPVISSTNPYPFTLQKYKIDLIKKAVANLYPLKSEAKPDLAQKPSRQ